MTDLPPGWEWTTLGEVGEWSGGATPSKSNDAFWENGTIPWISPKDINSPIISQSVDHITESALAGSPVRLIPPNSVVIVVRSGILERTIPSAVVPFATTLNQDLKALTPYPGISYKWVAHCLRAFEDNLLSDCRKSGTTVASIDVPRLMQLRIPLAPLAEQCRIVDSLETHLSSVVEGQRRITHAQRRLRNLQVMLLHSATERRSRHWEDVCIGELARVTSGATPRRGCAEYYDHGSIPWVTSSQLNWPFVEHATQFITERALKETSVKLLGAGTLLLAMYGEGRTRGKCSELMLSAATNQACAAIELKPQFADLRPWLKTVLEARYEANRRLSSGGVQPNLNLGLIKEMTIPLPSAEERHNILAALDARRAESARLQSGLTKTYNRADALRRTLLIDAFSGLLVPQDSSNEPASVLLARIRDERVARPKARRALFSPKTPNHAQGSLL